MFGHPRIMIALLGFGALGYFVLRAKHVPASSGSPLMIGGASGALPAAMSGGDSGGSTPPAGGGSGGLKNITLPIEHGPYVPSTPTVPIHHVPVGPGPIITHPIRTRPVNSSPGAGLRLRAL